MVNSSILHRGNGFTDALEQYVIGPAIDRHKNNKTADATGRVIQSAEAAKKNAQSTSNSTGQSATSAQGNTGNQNMTFHDWATNNPILSEKLPDGTDPSTSFINEMLKLSKQTYENNQDNPEMQEQAHKNADFLRNMAQSNNVNYNPNLSANVPLSQANIPQYFPMNGNSQQQNAQATTQQTPNVASNWLGALGQNTNPLLNGNYYSTNVKKKLTDTTNDTQNNVSNNRQDGRFDVTSILGDNNAMINDPYYKFKVMKGFMDEGLTLSEAQQAMQYLDINNSVTQAKTNYYLDLYKKALQGGNIQDADMVIAEAYNNGAGDNVIKALGLMNPHYKDKYGHEMNVWEHEQKTNINHNNWEKEAATTHKYQQDNIRLQGQVQLQSQLARMDKEIENYKTKGQIDIANAIEKNKAMLNYYVSLGMPVDVAIGMATGGKKSGGSSGNGGSSSGDNYKKNEELSRAQESLQKWLETQKELNNGVLPADIKTWPEYQKRVNYINDLQELANNSVTNEKTRQWFSNFNFRKDKDGNLYLDDFDDACRFASGILQQVKNHEIDSATAGSTIENVCGDQSEAVFDAIGWYDGVNEAASQPHDDNSIEDRKRKAREVASSSYEW